MDTNMIKTCLQNQLDKENFAKFAEVLEFLGESVSKSLYKGYNDKLLDDFQKVSNYSFPGGYKQEEHVYFKIKFYSFRFITNIGRYLYQLRELQGEDKAEKYFIILVKILMHHSLMSKSNSANLALVELEQLCLIFNITLPNLYEKYRHKFLRLIIKAILQKLIINGETSSGCINPSLGSSFGPTRRSNCVITYMTRAFELFNIVTINSEDIAQSLIIITNLIHKEKYNDAIQIFLENLARYQNINIFTLIKTHIQAIMVSLLLKRKLSHFDMTASLNKLSQFCDKTPKDILLTRLYNIKGRVLLEYSINKKIVTDAIYYMSKFEKAESEQPFEDEFEEEGAFIDYINPTMIGILFGIDSHFTTHSKNMGDEESLNHIHSLTKLISLLSEAQVETSHHKLLSTLSLLLRLRPIRTNINLNAALTDLWNAYLSKLRKSSKESLLINIAVALYDLIEDCPKLAASLFTTLLKDINAVLLKSLFFIPKVQFFEQIYDQLTPHVLRNCAISSLEDLQESLESTLPLLVVESQRCHLFALIRIRELLKTNQAFLTSEMLISSDEPLAPIISKTIASVLALSSRQNPECSALIAECLGILGAINPIRLDQLIYGVLSDNEPIGAMSLYDARFLVGLIERLKNSLFSDRRSESEIANYALQVVVKTLKVCTESSIVDKLSPEALRVCQLCKDTNYMGMPRSPPNLSCAVYLQCKIDNQYSYSDWLDKFSLVLIPLIEDKEVQEVLYACTYTFKYNLKLAEYVLPMVVMQIVIHNPTKTEVLRREILAIINEDIGVSTQDLDTVYTQDVRSNIQTLHFQCTNMIFCILDGLVKLEGKAGTSSNLLTQQSKRLKDFNSSLPRERVAILASKCRAYARALYCFDQYFFENKNWPNTEKESDNATNCDPDKYLTPLQKVFISLDDTFDASGVDKLRTRPTTMSDELTNHESSGNFDEAFTWYSALIEVMENLSDKEPFLEDALKCLSNQGNDQQLYQMSKQLISDYPQLKQSILPSAIEACWKLRKWDELDKIFKNEPSELSLEQAPVGFGYLLSSLCESRAKTLDRLKIVRKRLMRPLSISMMDRNAYFRGYQNMLVLHCLEDFALALETLKDDQYVTQDMDENTMDIMRFNLSEKYESLIEIWKKRNKLVQPSQKCIEPLLAWQRSISAAFSRKYPFLKDKINVDVGRMWLNSAEFARDARSFGRSAYCLSRARVWFGSNFHNLNLDLRVKYIIVQAKHEWGKGEQTTAIDTLTHALQRMQSHGLYQHLKDRREKIEGLKTIKDAPPYDPFPDLNKSTSCDECNEFSLSDRNSFAQILTLLTRFSEEAGASMPDAMLFKYNECVHLGVNQEEIFLCLARYYDKLATYYVDNPQISIYSQAEKLYLKQLKQNAVLGFEKSLKSSQGNADADMEDVCTRLMEQSIVAFGLSMKYGVRYIEESMPRMLNIWFDLGEKKQPNQRVTLRDISSRIENTVRFIDTLCKPTNNGLPSYYFMTALSLLLSRVCHPHSGVTKTTADILERLVTDYPHQMLWKLIAMINDENSDRKKAATRMLGGAKKKDPRIEVIIRETVRFSEILRKLCLNYSPFDTTDRNRAKKLPTGCVDVRQIEPSVPNLKLTNIDVIMPTQASMQPVLPTANDCANLSEYNVFPRHRVAFIRGVETKARVFNSLQAPRQVTFRCDNGARVNLLCKPGDDLRKDSRCIEFFNLLNKVLRKGSQSSARFFEITTFLVLPLQSNAGIIEMVPNLETFRAIIERLYRERKSNFNIHDVGLPKRQRLAEYTNSHLYREYTTKALPRVSPPVFQNFFLKTFPEPTSWYMAKQAYVRSTAVISMGGYIVGLGDRHLDNILIDVAHGRVVHVDFNLLFHQAETLPCPETVPFRLTPNVIAAFGPVGVEGNFRKFCEIAMQAMRDEKEALLTTLKPFVYDPCSEWMKKEAAEKKDLDGDILNVTKDENDLKAKNRNEVAREREKRIRGSCENTSARSRIEVVERKLKGFPRSKEFKPLAMLNSYSVEAQVDKLIQEASDYYNLAQMYFGWAPHI